MIEFCKGFYPFRINIDEGFENLEELANFLELKPIDILNWDRVHHIYPADAKKYLSNSDEWLNNPNIVSKVEKDFLYEALKKNDNFYKYPELLENLNDEQIESIVLADDINYQKLPNIKKLLKSINYLLLGSEKEKIFAKCIQEPDLVSFYLTNLSDKNFLSKDLQNVKDAVSMSEFIKILDILPEDILNVVNDPQVSNQLFGNLSENDKNELLRNQIITKLNKSTIIDLAIKSFENFDLFIENNSLYRMCLDANVFPNDETFQVNLLQHIINNPDYYFSKIPNSELLKKYNSELLEIFVTNDKLKDSLLNRDNIKDIIISLTNNDADLNLFIALRNYPKIIVKLIEQNEFFGFLGKNENEKLLKIFDQNPEIEEKIFKDNNLYTKVIKTKKDILTFLRLLNKYGIENEITKMFNRNLKKIQENYQELSYGNSSLKVEMLEDDFINNIDMNILAGILEYDSDASNIVVDLYKNDKLERANQWFKYMLDEVNSNHRLLHRYILSYAKMEELANNIISEQPDLTAYQKQILGEIACNDNKYDIKSINDLKSYFKIKAIKICSKESLTDEDVRELFLNISSTKNARPYERKLFPHDIGEMNDTDFEYYRYKYVRNGIITEEELDYLKKVNDIFRNSSTYSENGILQALDINIVEVAKLVEESADKEVPTMTSIISRINKYDSKQIIGNLTNINELQEKASKTDSNAPIYLENVDGVNVIQLKDYDYCFIASTILEKNDDFSKASATFSHVLENDFEQYRIFSEKLKDLYSEKKIQLSDMKIGRILKETPEAWNLIEGISTISAGVSSARTGHDGYAWDSNANFEIIETAPGDGNVHHAIRCLNPKCGGTKSRDINILYGRRRAEFAFDRRDENNRRIQPSAIVTDKITEENINEAKYFNCPIIVTKGSRSDENIKKYQLENRKNFLQTGDMKLVPSILFYREPGETNNPKEGSDFLINGMNSLLDNGKITQQSYSEKMTELKWILYENNFKDEFKKVNDILKGQTIAEEKQKDNYDSHKL